MKNIVNSNFVQSELDFDKLLKSEALQSSTQSKVEQNLSEEVVPSIEDRIQEVLANKEQLKFNPTNVHNLYVTVTKYGDQVFFFPFTGSSPMSKEKLERTQEGIILNQLNPSNRSRYQKNKPQKPLRSILEKNWNVLYFLSK